MMGVYSSALTAIFIGRFFVQFCKIKGGLGICQLDKKSATRSTALPPSSVFFVAIEPKWVEGPVSFDASRMRVSGGHAEARLARYGTKQSLGWYITRLSPWD